MNTFVFFDDFMLWRYVGVRKRYYHPQEMPEAMFTINKMTGGTVIYCPEVGKYRMWYSMLPDPKNDWGRYPTFMESDDCINWREPDCGFEKAKEAPSVEVMLDLHEKDPAKRYKSVYVEYDDIDNANGYIAFSPDGINWVKDKKYQFCNYPSDTKNILYYNEVIDQYQLILRANHGDRRICCVRSENLTDWTQPELIMHPDPYDLPCTEYYGMTVFPMEGYFLGYLWLYCTDMYDTASIKMAGKVDSVLVYSYDGVHWVKAENRPLVERKNSPDFGSANIYMHSLVQGTKNNEWILSGGGNRIDHGCGFKPVYPNMELPELAEKEGKYANLFYKIRKEGFVGLESFGLEGEVVFKAVDLLGEDVFFNICAPVGWVKFQISEGNEKPIPGFGYDDSISFTGDEVRYKPQWKKRRLNELTGKKVIFELKMYMATLYSFSGEITPHMAHKAQKSLGNVSI